MKISKTENDIFTIKIKGFSLKESNFMMISRSLLGKWKLVKDGSDFLPGLDTLTDLPLVAKLLGNQEVEFFKIEKRKYVDVEELMFTYTLKNSSISRSFQ
jgi:hypothetical protein